MPAHPLARPPLRQRRKMSEMEGRRRAYEGALRRYEKTLTRLKTLSNQAWRETIRDESLLAGLMDELHEGARRIVSQARALELQVNLVRRRR